MIYQNQHLSVFTRLDFFIKHLQNKIQIIRDFCNEMYKNMKI
jgi:hypothetical protein